MMPMLITMTKQNLSIKEGMNMYANRKYKAIRADLSNYLITHHPEAFTLEYGSLRMKGNHSLSIKLGFPGYYDFGTGEGGNSLQFLVNYMGYDEETAIAALTEGLTEEISPAIDIMLNRKVEKLPPEFPEVTKESFKRIFAYLRGRAIPYDTTEKLVKAALLYQDHRNNAVFINKAMDWAEIRGINPVADARCGKRGYCPRFENADHQWCAHMDTCVDYQKDPFHIIAKNSREDGFWWFNKGENPEVCYVCEAAIDAISLYELHKREDIGPAIYASIGGVGKQKAINRIKRFKKVIIAVDNDEAGAACRDRNSDIESIIPLNKDWNEDLREIY